MKTISKEKGANTLNIMESRMILISMKKMIKNKKIVKIIIQTILVVFFLIPFLKVNLKIVVLIRNHITDKKGILSIDIIIDNLKMIDLNLEKAK